MNLAAIEARILGKKISGAPRERGLWHPVAPKGVKLTRQSLATAAARVSAAAPLPNPFDPAQLPEACRHAVKNWQILPTYNFDGESWVERMFFEKSRSMGFSTDPEGLAEFGRRADIWIDESVRFTPWGEPFTDWVIINEPPGGEIGSPLPDIPRHHIAKYLALCDRHAITMNQLIAIKREIDMIVSGSE